ncbi:MAG: VanZ family protein [Clostridia bacterium]|nr:VanZ family protein [Clostridia bacterium]
MAQKAGKKRTFPGWRAVWPWLAVLAVYTVIAWFSAQPGEVSDAQSALITDMLGFQAEWFTTLVRKFAHVSLFLGLGAAAGFASLRSDGAGAPRRFRRAVLRAVMLCAALAALDEFHQLFVPGRTGSVSDVALDTVSAALGALCSVGVARMWARRKRPQSFASTRKNARKNR